MAHAVQLRAQVHPGPGVPEEPTVLHGCGGRGRGGVPSDQALRVRCRVKALLVPSVPDPKSTFPRLFEVHQGNFQVRPSGLCSFLLNALVLPWRRGPAPHGPCPTPTNHAPRRPCPPGPLPPLALPPRAAWGPFPARTDLRSSFPG